MLQSTIQSILPEIIKIRQTIHQYPELCFEEQQTANLVVATLRSFGFDNIQTGVAQTGVVALLDSGKPGKTVALRADMDALPLQEETQSLAYKSRHHGKMHACGHDGHVATLLAAAYILKQHTNQFQGKIKFIFQPGEEGGCGAAKMIAQGVLESPQVDAIFGYHNWPNLATGHLSVRAGCMMAGSAVFEIIIHGKGGHAAIPDNTIDPIYIGTHMVQSLQSLASRLTSPVEPIVLSITKFQAGTTFNIIPDQAVLSGTLRTTSHKTQNFAIEQLQKIVQHSATMYGATAQINFSEAGFYLPTINSEAEVQLVMQTGEQLLGKAATHHMSAPTMGAEDFSFYLEKIPGCFFFMGNGETSAQCHSAKFNFNDAIITPTATLLAQVAMDYLNK